MRYRQVLQFLRRRSCQVLAIRNKSTSGNVISCPAGDVSLPRQTLHKFVFQNIARYPDKVAIECGITGKKYTFEQIRKLTDRLTASLQIKFGLKKNDCVCVVLPNLPEYPLLLCATSQAGLILTPVNPIYIAEEIAKQVTNSNSKVIFTTSEKYEAVSKCLHLIGKNLPVVLVKTREDESIPRGAVNFEELINDSAVSEFRNVDINVDDVFALPYSSGTTGLPKGVQLTHYNIVSNLYQLRHPDFTFSVDTTSEYQDKVLGVLPFYHIYGLSVVLLKSLSDCNKVISLPKFEPKSYMSALSTHKASILYIVPPLVLFLGGNSDVKKEDLSSVRVAVSGAAPCGEKDVERMKLRMNQNSMVMQGYGLTEASPVVLSQMSTKEVKSAAVGQPIPSTLVKIVDPETNQPQPVNKLGEILVSGPQVMKGYLNNEAANKDIFADGWLRTGDIGYYDENRNFYVVDRLKELIKVKGFQVAPAELEEILRSHPKVADAAVIGVPDQKYGEVPKAFVVSKFGEQTTEKEIQDFVAKQVSKHKHLSGGVEFLETIPKSAAGKILRKELRQKV